MENVTDKMCVERGLMLMKLNAKPEQRTELAELAKIFRASIVDVSPTSLTMSTVGDPGKNRAFQQACLKFGILEVARTGKLALKREPVFSESRRRRVKLMEAMKEARAAVAGLRGGSGSEKEELIASRIVRAVANMGEGNDGELNIGDTYAAMEDGDGAGVWDVPVLNAQYQGTGAGGTKEDLSDGIPKMDPNAKYTPHTISIVVMNKPGVLDVVTGVFLVTKSSRGT